MGGQANFFDFLTNFCHFFNVLRIFSAISWRIFKQIFCAESWGFYNSNGVYSFAVAITVVEILKDLLGPFWRIFTNLEIIIIFLQLYTLKQLNEYQPRHPKNKIFSIFAPTSLREAKIEKILFFGCLATVSEKATSQGISRVLVHLLFDFDILRQISSVLDK